MDTSILKKGSALWLCTILLATTASASADLTPEEACKTYLAAQTQVTTKGGDTYDLSKEDAHGAFESSSASIQHGASSHLLGSLQTDKTAGTGVRRVGKKLGELLKAGTPLESIRPESVLGPNDKIDFFKGALNYIINTFLWDKNLGVTTEVTAPETASALCLRTRFINFKKTLG